MPLPLSDQRRAVGRDMLAMDGAAHRRFARGNASALTAAKQADDPPACGFVADPPLEAQISGPARPVDRARREIKPGDGVGRSDIDAKLAAQAFAYALLLVRRQFQGDAFDRRVAQPGAIEKSALDLVQLTLNSLLQASTAGAGELTEKPAAAREVDAIALCALKVMAAEPRPVEAVATAWLAGLGERVAFRRKSPAGPLCDKLTRNVLRIAPAKVIPKRHQQITPVRRGI
jgi:hypothetical protein